MPRKCRIAYGGHVYHVVNRAAGKRLLFSTSPDYDAFEHVIAEAKAKIGMRILAYCLMPNHWHFLLWPERDGDLAKFVQWLTATHARSWNAAHQCIGHGAVYQSRFKSIPVNSESHLLVVYRYVERNALRANLVTRAEEWKWGTLWHRLHQSNLLAAGPCRLPENWVELVNTPQTGAELEAIREHVVTGTPYGPGSWPVHRKPGRPRIYDTYQ